MRPVARLGKGDFCNSYSVNTKYSCGFKLLVDVAKKNKVAKMQEDSETNFSIMFLEFDPLVHT